MAKITFSVLILLPLLISSEILIEDLSIKTADSAENNVEARAGFGSSFFYYKPSPILNWIWPSTTAPTTTTSNPKLVPISNKRVRQQPSAPAAAVEKYFGKQEQRLNCSAFEIEYKGQCTKALGQFPCDQGQWLVEDEVTQKGKCEENKCAGQTDMAFYQGKCVQVRSDEQCNSGLKVYLYKTGKAECDCKDGFLYNDRDQNCYEAYRQGPCKSNQMFAIPKSASNKQSRPACIPNPCLIDGYFCNAPRCIPKKGANFGVNSAANLPRNCIKFGSPCTSDGKGILVIHPESNRPFCQLDLFDFHTPTRIIGNVPRLQCAPGSRRDILGNCRTPTIIDFSR